MKKKLIVVSSVLAAVLLIVVISITSSRNDNNNKKAESTSLIVEDKKPETVKTDQDDSLWTLGWHDEFDGTSLDGDKWTYDIGNKNGWGNNELEYYTDSKNNAYLDKNDSEAKDGKLVIKAIKETSPEEGGKTFDYTSSKIKTLGKFSMKYGRVDVRAKLPKGNGLWPAIWMLPVKDVYGGWAASGEIDIMENKGRLPGEVYGTLHYGSTWPKNKYTGGTYKFPEGQSTTQYHVYSLEWEPGEIRWYVDGILFETQTSWYSKGIAGEEKYSFPAPFDQEFYLILNLALGGNFDGNKSVDENKMPATMDVDYVRTYNLTGRPYKVAQDVVAQSEPLPAEAKKADASGNLLSNSDFSKPIVDNPSGGNKFGEDWNFVHIADAAGAGTQTIEKIDGKNYARVDIASPGTKDYAVQLIQCTTVGKGRWYKLSFDAKAASKRTIGVKVSGGSDRSWIPYSDTFSYDLNTSFKRYQSTFQMNYDTDLNGRLEFELGLNTSSVWIGNVKFEEIQDPAAFVNGTKDPLAVSGNLIYNGAFDKGNVSRTTYWTINNKNAEAAASVPEDTRELNVDITNGGTEPSSITLAQSGLQLEKNNAYELTFKARAASDRTIKVKLASSDGVSSYVKEVTFNLTAAMETYKLPFNMKNNTDLESQLVFMLGGNTSKVYIDDVSLIKTTVDYTGVELYPLKNGDFSQDFEGWEQFKQDADAAFSLENGKAKISAVNLGSNPWNIMLVQSGMSFSKGIEYVLSFDASSSVNRDILVTLENATYIRSVDSGELQLTPETKNFTFTFKPSATDTLALKIQLGKTSQGAAGDIFIDNVVLQVKNPPKK
jgi:beta-glucanase (GH16 family)